jgi:hypothetical protein
MQNLDELVRSFETRIARRTSDDVFAYVILEYLDQ